MERTIIDELLTPIRRTTKRFYIFLAALLVGVGIFLFAWHHQLTQGLIVTGMRDIPGGAPWGLYMSNFWFFVSIAPAGIAISAAAYVFNLKAYKPITRMAELIAVIALMMGFLSLVLDLGRPDRVFNMIVYYWERVGQSPIAWDLTMGAICFALYAAYIYLPMREDLAICSKRFPKWRWLYRPLLLGYKPEEKKKVERLKWWLAITILPITVLYYGGVIPWIFGLMGGRPGWYGAMLGPWALTAALASAMAAVIVVVAIHRRLFKWQNHINSNIFRGLGAVLGITILVYLYFTLSEQLTIGYAGPVAQLKISEALLFGGFALPYWVTLIVGLFIPSVILLIQAICPKVFSITKTVVAAILVLIALWVMRVLVVLPSLLNPLLPYPAGTYVPTWVEWSLVGGIFVIAALLFTIFIKLFPIMKLEGS